MLWHRQRCELLKVGYANRIGKLLWLFAERNRYGGGYVGHSDGHDARGHDSGY